jgi:hypothetical protein
MYFDQPSGLLVRVVRYGTTPIGRVPTQGKPFELG